MPYCNPPDGLMLNVPRMGLYDGIEYTLLEEHKTAKALVQKIQCRQHDANGNFIKSYVETERHAMYPVFGGPVAGGLWSTIELVRLGIYDQYHRYNSGMKDNNLPSMIFMHKSHFED